MTRCFVVLATVPLVGGCGLIDSNITDFDLSLPQKQVVLDTAQWELQVDGEFPAVPCDDAPAVCQAASQDYCTGASCFPACDGQNCKVTVQVALWNTFDLVNEKPELKEIEDEPLVTVTIDSIKYSVTENTMNVSTPVLTVYVAPQSVMNPGDPQARAVGTIAAIAPGVTVTDGNIAITGEGQQALKDYLKDFTTPFNVIVGGVVEVKAGDPVPEGRLVATVDVTAHAGI